MALQTSNSPNIPPDYEVIKKYKRVTEDGTDMLSALQALVDKVEAKYPNVNWVLGISFSDIPGVECSATGHPYQLEKI